jgi:very-short-patch-repair endonuclease
VCARGSGRRRSPSRRPRLDESPPRAHHAPAAHRCGSVRSARAASARLARPAGDARCRGRATSVGGVVSHASAAVWWRLALARVPDVVHVTVQRGSRRAPVPGVRYHWVPSAAMEAAAAAEFGTVTSILQTVLDCAATMPFDEALAIADSALALHLVAPAALLAAAASSPRTGRQRRLRIARSADGRAANAFESRLRAIVLDAGVASFEPQVTIELSCGRRVRVDLADRARRVVLEADSFEHHGGRADLARDCERYDELVADGWTVLRFASEIRLGARDVPARVGGRCGDSCRPSPIRRWSRPLAPPTR